GTLAPEDGELGRAGGGRGGRDDGTGPRARGGGGVPPAHGGGAELQLVNEGGGGNDPRRELDTARRAASASAAGRLDVHAGRVSRRENGHAWIDLESAPGGKKGERHHRHFFEDTTSPLTSQSALPIVAAPHEPLGATAPQLIREARCSSSHSSGFSG